MRQEYCVKFDCIVHGNCNLEVEENCACCEWQYDCESCTHQKECGEDRERWGEDSE